MTKVIKLETRKHAFHKWMVETIKNKYVKDEKQMKAAFKKISNE